MVGTQGPKASRSKAAARSSVAAEHQAGAPAAQRAALQGGWGANSTGASKRTIPKPHRVRPMAEGGSVTAAAVALYSGTGRRSPLAAENSSYCEQ